MTPYVYNLFDQIHNEGLSGNDWGMLDNTNTTDFFGTTEANNVDLSGHWAFVLRAKGETFNFIKEEPTTTTLDPSGLEIMLYCLDDE